MKSKQIIYACILIAMVVNIFLAFYIQDQKIKNDSLTENSELGTCFAGDGGCATVQTSSYATTFGIPNPIYGLVSFPILALLAGLLLTQKKVTQKLKLSKTIIYLILLCGLVIGSLFSLWLLYVQFFILKTSCIYCLWVDGLTITSMILLFLVSEETE